MTRLMIKQEVLVDLTGIVTASDGEIIEVTAAGMLLDHDTSRQLATVKIDDSEYRPGAVIIVPATRVSPKT